MREPDWWTAVRRRLKDWLRRAAQAADPDRTWHLPERYTARDVAAFHDLMVDIGFDDAYDESQGEMNGSAHLGPAGAGEALAAAADTGTISSETAAKIRSRALSEEAMAEMHRIVLDLRGRDPLDVPVDVSVWALQHFIPAYATYVDTLAGTPSGTTSA
jgi:hypothetical protein